MKNLHSFKTFAAIFFALAATNCDQPTLVMNPSNVPYRQRPFFGSVQVFKDGYDITTGCVITVTDTGSNQISQINLVDKGWIFSAAGVSRVHLSSFKCPNGVEFSVPNLEFDLPGGRMVGYFGDVRIDLGPAGTTIPVDPTANGGVPTVPLSVIYQGGVARAQVENRIDNAAANYLALYHGDRRYWIVPSLAGPTAQEVAKMKVQDEANKERVQAWANWTATYKGASCAEALEQFKRNAACTGDACKNSLFLSEGYRTSCPMDESAKIEFYRWRHHWEREVK